MTTARTVRADSGDVELAGTLLLPDAANRVPAALLVPGSGPVDRDSDHARLPLGVTRLLAEALADAGIASLRFDKRGVGDSGGDHLSSGMHDATADAATMLAVLARQPEVDAGRLLVIGHSEGAFHAMALAAASADGAAADDSSAASDGADAAATVGTTPAADVTAARRPARPTQPATTSTRPGADSPRLAGVALLAGAARPGAEVLRWQAGAIAPTLPAPVRAILRILRVDLVDKNAKAVAKLRATTKDVERVGGRRQNARWFREFLDVDPRDALARLDVPVLAVTGSKDVQAPPEDVAAMEQVVTAPFEGHVVPDVNHILRHEPASPSPSHYKKQADQPLAEEVVTLVTDWATRVTA